MSQEQTPYFAALTGKTNIVPADFATRGAPPACAGPAHGRAGRLRSRPGIFSREAKIFDPRVPAHPARALRTKPHAALPRLYLVSLLRDMPWHLPRNWDESPTSLRKSPDSQGVQHPRLRSIGLVAETDNDDQAPLSYKRQRNRQPPLKIDAAERSVNICDRNHCFEVSAVTFRSIGTRYKTLTDISGILFHR